MVFPSLYIQCTNIAGVSWFQFLETSVKCQINSTDVQIIQSDLGKRLGFLPLESSGKCKPTFARKMKSKHFLNEVPSLVKFIKFENYGLFCDFVFTMASSEI